MAYPIEVKNGQFSGVGLVCDKITPANRVYPKAVIEKALIEFQKKIKQNNAFLMSSAYSAFDGLDIQHIIGIIKSASLCGNEVVITGELLDKAKSLDDQTLHVYSAGFGCVDIDSEKQTATMKDDFELECFVVEEKE